MAANISFHRSCRGLSLYMWLAIVLYFIIAKAISTDATPPPTGCNPTKPVDVIIVGAGIAGLAASTKLVKAGKCVLVLEADQQLGGKCRNWRIKNLRDYTKPKAPIFARDVPVSVGGSFYNPDLEKNLAALIEEAGLTSLQFPPAYIDPNDFPPMVLPPALVSHNPKDYSIFSQAYMIGATYPDLRAAPSEIQALQGITVEQWLASPKFASATAAAKEMVREFVYSQMSIDASKQDTYSFCQYVSQIVPYDADSQTFPNGANPLLIYQLIGGTGRLVEALSAKLAMFGVRFRKATTVHAIIDRPNQPIAVQAIRGGKKLTFQAKEFVIVTVGPKQARKIIYKPNLGQDIRNVMAGEQGHKTVDYQVFAFFKDPWWFALPGLRSPVIIPPQQLFRDLKHSRGAPKIMGMTVAVPPIISDSPEVQDLGVMRIMVPGEFFKSSPKSLRKDVTEYLRFFNFTVPPGQLLDAKVFAWDRVKSVNHGLFKTSVLVDHLDSKYMQVNNSTRNRLIFAGTETTNQFRNLMEGAAISGFFAADRVLNIVAIRNNQQKR